MYEQDLAKRHIEDYVAQYDINMRPWKDVKFAHRRYQDIFDFKKLHDEKGKFRSTKMSPDMDYKVDGKGNGLDDSLTVA